MTTNIDTITTNIFNMIVFDKLKMGNPIIDMIMTSIWILCQQQDRESRIRKLKELDPNIEQRDLILLDITSNKIIYEYKWFKDKKI